MARYAALLRGVNVGGHNRVPMAELRALVESLGGSDVATYIQSGNVVFSSTQRDPALLATKLERAIAERFDVHSATLVVSAADLDRVVAANPFAAEPDPKKVHIIFTPAALGPEVTAAVVAAEQRAQQRGSRDRVRVQGSTVFLHTPDGFGRSELAAQLTGGRRSALAGGTARNWATVTTLAAMLSA